jgi:hypothetical protein
MRKTRSRGRRGGRERGMTSLALLLSSIEKTTKARNEQQQKQIFYPNFFFGASHPSITCRARR